MTFSDFNNHTNPKGQQLNLVNEYFGKILPDDLYNIFDFSIGIPTTHHNLIISAPYS